MTVTVVTPPSAAGAEYRPLVGLMLPASGVDGWSDHVTAVFALPVTCAVNCCACPTVTVAVFGLTVTVSVTAGSSVTWAMAHTPALQQALIVATVLVATEGGAVYRLPTKLPRLAFHEMFSGVVQTSDEAVRQVGANVSDSPAWSWAVAGRTPREAAAMGNDGQRLSASSPLLCNTFTEAWVIFPPIDTGMTTWPVIRVSVTELTEGVGREVNLTTGWAPNPVPVIVNCVVLPACH